MIWTLKKIGVNKEIGKDYLKPHLSSPIFFKLFTLTSIIIRHSQSLTATAELALSSFSNLLVGSFCGVLSAPSLSTHSWAWAYTQGRCLTRDHQDCWSVNVWLLQISTWHRVSLWRVSCKTSRPRSLVPLIPLARPRSFRSWLKSSEINKTPTNFRIFFSTWARDPLKRRPFRCFSVLLCMENGYSFRTWSGAGQAKNN